uniref:amino acid ABC transporter substrate-binding protein n=1 Tax=Halobacteriovorax sp. TaxID=2020862 RepID=UPI00356AACE8
MKYVYIVFTTLLFIYSKPSFSSSDNRVPPVLRIGTMDLRPYGWRDKTKVKHGIIFEMNEELGKRLGLPYVNKVIPFKRLIKLLEDGSIDIISAQAHEEVLSVGEKLEVQFEIDVIAGTRKNSNIKSIQDFKGKHLVYHRSASYKELEGLPSRIIYVNGYRQALGFLHKNRHADAAIFSEPAYYYWMKDMGLSRKDFGNVIMITPNKKQWIFVRKDLNIELKNKIKETVKEIYKEDLYKNLLVKYGKN